MSKHTPGPWALWGNANPSQVISYEDGFIAQTVGGNDEANARLIAAAPELLEALIRLEAELVEDKYGECYEPSPFENLALARAAIAKAIGE